MTARHTIMACLAALAPCAMAASCQDKVQESMPQRDLTMLYRMIELDAAQRGIEPYLRDRSRYTELAETADAIAELAGSDLLRSWPERPDFVRAKQPWERFRQDLEQASRDAAHFARAGDADGLHEAFSRMDGSCIACHKRYHELH